jgi:hypothetical protein
MLRGGGSRGGACISYHACFRGLEFASACVSRCETRFSKPRTSPATTMHAMHSHAQPRAHPRARTEAKDHGVKRKNRFRPGTLVTDQTGDMGYSPGASSAVRGGPHDAMGKDRLDDRTSEVHCCLPTARGPIQRSVSGLRDQQENGIQVGASLRSRRRSGPGRALASSPRTPKRCSVWHRRVDPCDPSASSTLGAAQGAGHPETTTASNHPSRSKHDRRHPEAQRTGPASSDACAAARPMATDSASTMHRTRSGARTSRVTSLWAVGLETHVVYPNGVITFGATQWYVSHCLAGERLGVEPCDDGRWRVHYAWIPIGIMDLRKFEERGPRQFGRLIPIADIGPRRRRRRYGG